MESSPACGVATICGVSLIGALATAQPIAPIKRPVPANLSVVRQSRIARLRLPSAMVEIAKPRTSLYLAASIDLLPRVLRKPADRRASPPRMSPAIPRLADSADPRIIQFAMGDWR